MELINQFERTSGIFLAYVLNTDVLYNIYMLNMYILYIFLICFRLMKDLLIRTINQKRLMVNTLAVQQFEFLIFFQEFSSGVFGLSNVTLSNILWCDTQCS